MGDGKTQRGNSSDNAKRGRTNEVAPTQFQIDHGSNRSFDHAVCPHASGSRARAKRNVLAFARAVSLSTAPALADPERRTVSCGAKQWLVAKNFVRLAKFAFCLHDCTWTLVFKHLIVSCVRGVNGVRHRKKTNDAYS
mmetsp:Transcript_18240/g.34532  ORF Transcript_18240/g.34532 Transcript_18240/m.34532 type:complete len:138 (-) Transcript_18240:2-415(-)